MGRAQPGSPCLHLRASHLCREADRTDPPSPAGRPGRGSGSGGSASWEGPVGREAAAGAGAGRSARGGTWEAPAARGGVLGWGAVPFPCGPDRRRLPLVPGAARSLGRLYLVILLFSRSPPAPCGHFPYSPRVGSLGSVRNLFLNTTKTGSATRVQGRPSGASLRRAGPRGPGSGLLWRGARAARGGLGWAGAAGPRRSASGAASPSGAAAGHFIPAKDGALVPHRRE